jgi:hypothetical protein
MGKAAIRTPADDPDSDFMNDSRILEGITLAELVCGEESLEFAEVERIADEDAGTGPRAQTPAPWKVVGHA